MSKSFSLELGPGHKWSARIGRYRTVRFEALEAGASVALLLYNADDPAERLNLPDSLKCQHMARISEGVALYSEMGRVLASVVQDSIGWHDPIGGLSHQDQVDERYGATNFQVHRNARLRPGYDNVLVELAKHGLGRRDIVPNLNLFTRIWADPEGNLHYDVDHCSAGATVTLRTEMDVLLVVSNTPHPLDPRTPYPAVPVRMVVEPCAPPTAEDRVRNSAPENVRGFENTEHYHLLCS